MTNFATYRNISSKKLGESLSYPRECRRAQRCRARRGWRRRGWPPSAQSFRAGGTWAPTPRSGAGAACPWSARWCCRSCSCNCTRKSLLQGVAGKFAHFSHVIKSRNVARAPTEWLRMCWNSVTSFSLSLSSMTDVWSGLGTLARKLP